MRTAAIVRKQIISYPFTLGALVIFAWFFWKGSVNDQYRSLEWVTYFILALITWEPVSAWLREGARWVPAAELFFLAHLQFYVAPFVNSKDEIIELQSDVRLKTGLVIIGFLLFCRLFYALFRRFVLSPQTRAYKALDRELDFGPGKTIVWVGLVAWTAFSMGAQQGWLPNLGSNFNLVRTIFSSAGTLSIFILFYEMGSARLKLGEQYWLLIVTIFCLGWSISSGFLIGATLQASVGLVAFSIGRKKIPVFVMSILIAVLAFLHVGKQEMRAQFWSGEQTASVLSIYDVWLSASWERLMDPEAAEKKLPSIFDRGSLLQYLSRVVSETPEKRPYIDGKTYIDSFTNFVPRFLWPDKPSANAANDFLSVYYGFLTIEATERTSVATGTISEAWANFGWLGIGLIGMTLGLVLCLPTVLSIDSSPMHLRFLLSIPFITFAINLEMILGHGLQSLAQGLFATFVCLFLVSKSRRPLSETSRADSVRPIPRNAVSRAEDAYFIK